MATPKLTTIQKEVNAKIKSVCPKCKAFTYYDFKKTNSIASELLTLYSKMKNEPEMRDIFEFLSKRLTCIEEQGIEIKTLHPDPSEIPDNEKHKSLQNYEESIQDLNTNSYLKSHYQKQIDNFNTNDFTKQSILNLKPLEVCALKNIIDLFGLEETTYVAKKMLHSDYADTSKIKAYKENLTLWVDYCRFVDNLIDFMQETYPRWNKMKKEEKTNLPFLYDIVSNNYFKKNPHMILKVPEFLNTYAFNQKNNAKRDNLLRFNFPNMTDEIANILLSKSNKL